MTLSATELAARALSKLERVAYLKSRGWECFISTGSQEWFDPQTDARYTLALAVRVALDDENPPSDTPHQRAQHEIERAWACRYESPMVCDVCHATLDRIAERGHLGDCSATGRHAHHPRLAITDCAEWTAHQTFLRDRW